MSHIPETNGSIVDLNNLPINFPLIAMALIFGRRWGAQLPYLLFFKMS
jgi:hypothetical protein